MIEKRNYACMQEIASYMEKVNQDLIQTKNILMNQISSINDYYKGIDSKLIVNKFLNATKVLDQIVEMNSYYGDYLKTISNKDIDNVNSSYDKLSNLMNEEIIEE